MSRRRPRIPFSDAPPSYRYGMERDGKGISKTEYARRRRYKTSRGAAYWGHTLDLIQHVDDKSVSAIITSPPFALNRKKAYGNPPQNEYIDWFLVFAKEFDRVLKDDGSLVIELGGGWIPGSPTRSVYQFELLVELVKNQGWHLAEEFFWFNKAKLPSPANWVNIERIRVKDAVTPIWWLSKDEYPKANNRNVLKPYSEAQHRLFKDGYNKGARPSGHVVGDKFDVDNGGAIPPNLIQVANTRAYDSYQEYCREHGHVIHPARFPREIPEFFIKFLTSPRNLVLDPFGGSNMTGAVAERLKRRWLTFELNPDYLDGSVGRFDRETTKVHVNKKPAR